MSRAEKWCQQKVTKTAVPWILFYIGPADFLVCNDWMGINFHIIYLTLKIMDNSQGAALSEVIANASCVLGVKQTPVAMWSIFWSKYGHFWLQTNMMAAARVPISYHSFFFHALFQNLNIRKLTKFVHKSNF